MRSGFTHVRMCLDCQQNITEDNVCGCTTEHNPFVKGAAITVCIDKACTLPMSLVEIGRIGNGAFRIKGTDHWYNFKGESTTGKGTFVRLRQTGDEESIQKMEANKARNAKIKRLEQSVESEQEVIASVNVEIKSAEQAILKHEAEAVKIDVKQEGEQARVQAEARARQRIAFWVSDAARYRQSILEKRVKVNTRLDLIKFYQKEIEALKKE